MGTRSAERHFCGNNCTFCGGHVKLITSFLVSVLLFLSGIIGQDNEVSHWSLFILPDKSRVIGVTVLSDLVPSIQKETYGYTVRPSSKNLTRRLFPITLHHDTK